MEQPPVSDEIARAFSSFFPDASYSPGEGFSSDEGASASMELLTTIFEAAGYPDIVLTPREMVRARRNPRSELVRKAIHGAADGPGDPRKLIDGLLIHLRADGIFDSRPEHDRLVSDARAALAKQGWHLSADGYLAADWPAYFRVGGRPALDDAIIRLQRSTAGRGDQLTFARTMLIAVARHVLQQTGTAEPEQVTFGQLWELALGRLGMLPDQVADVAGDQHVRAMLASSWTAVEQLNELWGHSQGADKTVPAGVTRELVLFSVRQACFFAEFVLAVLDRRRAATVGVPAGRSAEGLEPRWYAENELAQRQQAIAEEERRRALMRQQQQMRA